ncbi:MAG: glycosyltransferase family 1 protein, partial [Rhizobacter sp.]|nr:glycosyltransferase family 1 protein [Rhizobacter sp.]
MSSLLINGRFLTRPLTGVDRFAIELREAHGAGLPAGAPQPRVMTPDAPLVNPPAFANRSELLRVG